jgi:hypothetical protein
VTEGWGGYFDSEDEIEPRTPPMTTEADKRFWLVLQERGCVPRRKGPWPLTETAARLREFIAANPTAYIYVLMLDYRGEPQIQWGPECLQMLDGRSMSVGRKHNERIASMEAVRPPVGEGWQPIETAPKDGTEILVWLDAATVPVVHLAWYRSEAEWQESGQYCGGGWDSLDDWLGWWSYTRGSVTQERLDGYHEPKFWMPYGAPPILAMQSNG